MTGYEIAQKVLSYFSIEQWPFLYEAVNFPVDSGLSEYLWRWSNSGCIPIEYARSIMRNCGYIPFSGFPLSRSGKIRTMSKQQCNEIVFLITEIIRINKLY